jgi:hypothetical protein
MMLNAVGGGCLRCSKLCAVVWIPSRCGAPQLRLRGAALGLRPAPTRPRSRIDVYMQSLVWRPAYNDAFPLLRCLRVVRLVRRRLTLTRLAVPLCAHVQVTAGSMSQVERDRRRQLEHGTLHNTPATRLTWCTVHHVKATTRCLTSATAPLAALGVAARSLSAGGAPPSTECDLASRDAILCTWQWNTTRPTLRIVAGRRLRLPSVSAAAVPSPSPPPPPPSPPPPPPPPPQTEGSSDPTAVAQSPSPPAALVCTEAPAHSAASSGAACASTANTPQLCRYASSSISSMPRGIWSTLSTRLQQNFTNALEQLDTGSSPARVPIRIRSTRVCTPACASLPSPSPPAPARATLPAAGAAPARARARSSPGSHTMSPPSLWQCLRGMRMGSSQPLAHSASLDRQKVTPSSARVASSFLNSAFICSGKGQHKRNATAQTETHAQHVHAAVRRREGRAATTHLPQLQREVVVNVRDDHRHVAGALPHCSKAHGAYHPACSAFLGERVALDVTAAVAYAQQTQNARQSATRPLTRVQRVQ